MPVVSNHWVLTNSNNTKQQNTTFSGVKIYKKMYFLHGEKVLAGQFKNYFCNFRECDAWLLRS